MKKLYSLFLFLVLTSVFTFVSCQKDDGVTPEPGINPDNEAYDAKLDGIWMKTSQGTDGGQNVPVKSDEYTFLVLEPSSRAAIFYDTQEQNYQECGMFVKSDSLAMIDYEVYNEIGGELGSTRSSVSDYDLITKNQNLKDIVTTGTYKLESDNSLVIFSNLNGRRIYSSFARMTEVEQQFAGGRAQSLNIESSRNKMAEAIKYIESKLKQNSTSETNKEVIFSIGTVKYYEENFDNKNGWTYSNWLSCLPDDMPINDIVIPGAHDACTASLGMVAKNVNADCQSLRLKDLLEAGVRFFDIRTTFGITDYAIFGENMNTVSIAHGWFKCEEKFVDVIDIMRDFLKKNKGEFIIMKVKYESTSTSRRDWTCKYDHQLMNKNKDIIEPFEPVEIGKVRGKILLINDLDLPEESQRIGTYINYRNSENKSSKDGDMDVYKNGKKVGTHNFWIQEYYEFDNLFEDEIHAKLETIKDYAKEASVMEKTPILINQLNASSFSLKNLTLTINVVNIARLFNPYTLTLFAENMSDSSKPRYKGGLYYMDYAGIDDYSFVIGHYNVWGRTLVWNLIQRNFYGISDKAQKMYYKEFKQ